MSDYIITCDDEVAMWVGNDVESMKEIVRCRDCVFMNPWGLEKIDFECVRQYDPFDVTPDGYCAWGERRKDE